MSRGQLEKDLYATIVAFGSIVLAKPDPDELLQRAEALVMREKALIDLCHAVTSALEADPPRVKEALELLEMVRFWSYPVRPPENP